MLFVAAFVGSLVAFRSLAPVLVCFVILERSLGYAASQVMRRTPLRRSGAIASLLTVLALLIGGVLFLAVQRMLPMVQFVREHGSEYLAELAHHPSVERLRAMAGLEHEPLSHVVRKHAGTALQYATGTAHIVVFLLIGFVLAIIYLFEREELEAWTSQVARDSLSGTLMRWFGYVADAIAVTVKMQVVVAIVSAVVTLPVLLFLGLPNVPVLFLLLLVTGLVPVVGNMIAGLVLCYVAYTAKGLWAVGVFLGVTFVLHKIESYYLNPKLAAQHVKLPGLVLVVSLLLFEQMLGFAGLFLSFPALYVASRIVHEWREDDRQRDGTNEAPSR
jgi:predicted PurR-regulated permease PerM